MTTITVSNDPEAPTFPVTISSSITSSGELGLSCEGQDIGEGDQLFAKHDRVEDEDPVVVPVIIHAPLSSWIVSAVHTDAEDDEVYWQGSGTSWCSYTWGETDQEYELRITARDTSSGAEKTKTIYIKVRPEPDKPD